jgi:transposase InsO family protein
MRRQRADASAGRVRYSLERVCRAVGVSRQSHYHWQHRREERANDDAAVIEAVLGVRHRQPRLGGRKLYYLLCKTHAELMQGTGRDRFFAVLRKARLLVYPRKRTVRTTYSQRWRRRYVNQIKNIIPAYPGHVLVADITYLRIKDGFVYLALVTDLYSRNIVGYDLSRSLEQTGALRALRMALARLPRDIVIIHHSDRGLQYYSEAYVKTIESRPGSMMSMTNDGNVYENAIAERVNGILKVEYDLYRTFDSFKDAWHAVAEAVRIYNTERPHLALEMATPEQRFTAVRAAA